MQIFSVRKDEFTKQPCMEHQDSSTYFLLSVHGTSITNHGLHNKSLSQGLRKPILGSGLIGLHGKYTRVGQEILEAGRSSSSKCEMEINKIEIKIVTSSKS